MRNLLKILWYLGLALGLVTLAMLNAEARVAITLWPGRGFASVPVFVVILGSMFFGVVVAGLVTVVDQARLRRSRRDLERQLLAARRELRELRNLPLGDHHAPEPDRSGRIES